MTTAQRLGSLIKSARQIMRKDKGLNGDLDRLPLFTWILFLKFLDDMETAAEDEAKLGRKKYQPVIQPPYRWRDWAVKADGIRAILQRTDPEVVLRPQNAGDWKGEYPLPAAVATYYAELGPDDVSIRGYGNGYFLPSLARLWAYQTGYRTHGHTGERLSDWEEDWLVVSDEGGDPFIFSRERGVVLRTYHVRVVGSRRSFSVT